MRFHIFQRKLHYWIGGIVVLPLFLVVASGLLLQLKKQVAWVQPAEQQASVGAPQLTLPQILDVARSVPEAQVRAWSDIERVDLRPERNLIKVSTRSRREIQIDATTGAVLQVAERRSDLIESLHDGSWFGPGVKLWIFLPVGIGLLFLALSGLWLFWHPRITRKRRGAELTNTAGK